ncbi:MAG: 2-phosphosulfolactate phosphatase [Candidatus Algichlamydia australiensis]|nr:2-phosphosulfolactate phosphatase [Chlamydiales bacterium]
MKIAVVIDAFRAFATAAYVLEQQPEAYFYSTSCEVVSHLKKKWRNSLLIGKPQKNSSVIYDIPNSPKRTFDLEIKDRVIIHRTEAGSKGILAATKADLIFAVGFGNAKATANHIQTFSGAEIALFPMGHEGERPSLEDNLCADYFSASLQGKKWDLSSHLSAIKAGPGRYFFQEDQWQYPEEDYPLCTTLERFNFAIEASVVGEYAILEKRTVRPLAEVQV